MQEVKHVEDEEEEAESNPHWKVNGDIKRGDIGIIFTHPLTHFPTSIQMQRSLWPVFRFNRSHTNYQITKWPGLMRISTEFRVGCGLDTVMIARRKPITNLQYGDNDNNAERTYIRPLLFNRS